MGREQKNSQSSRDCSQQHAGMLGRWLVKKIYSDKSNVGADGPFYPVFNKRYTGLVRVRPIWTAPSNFPKTGKVRDKKIFAEFK